MFQHKYIFLLPLGFILAAVGTLWDASWHRTIGRDTLFSLPHLLSLGAIAIPFCVSLYLITKATFSNRRENLLHFGKFTGPSGAWLAMLSFCFFLTSFFFDDWFHNVFGLDVTPLTPPHFLLFLSGFFMLVSVFLLYARLLNLNAHCERNVLDKLALIAGGAFLATTCLMYIDTAIPNLAHNANYYYVFPILLFLIAMVASFTQVKWAATLMTIEYTLLWLCLSWLIMQFAGEPRLGPVYNPRKTMAGLPFVLMLIPVGVGFDILYNKTLYLNKWVQAILLGTVLLGVFLLTQWYYTAVMLSASPNSWTMAQEFPYFVDPAQPWWHSFWLSDTDAQGKFSPLLFLQRLTGPWILTILFTKLGLWLSKQLKQVKT